MRIKFSTNLFLVVLLYGSILITGLLGILTRPDTLFYLGILLAALLLNLLRISKKGK